MSNQNSHIKPEEISLKDLILSIQDFIRFLLNKWYYILLFGIAGIIGGYYYVERQEIKYKSTTTFIMDSGGESNIKLNGLASALGNNMGGSDGMFQGNNLYELYKSRSIIQKTLLSPLPTDSSRIILDIYVSISPNLKVFIENNPEIGSLIKHTSFWTETEPQNRRIKDSILTGIVSNINSNMLVVGKKDAKSNIIQVDVESTSEEFSKEFNDLLVQNVNDFYLEMTAGKAIKNVAILQYKVDSLRARMNGEIFTSAIASDQAPNLNPTKRSISTIPIETSRFNLEITKSLLAELNKNLELSKLSLNKEKPLIQILDSTPYPLEIIKLSPIKGAIIGFIVFIFSALIILSIIKVYKNIMN